MTYPASPSQILHKTERKPRSHSPSSIDFFPITMHGLPPCTSACEHLPTICPGMVCMLWTINCSVHHTEIIELLACVSSAGYMSTEGINHVLCDVISPAPRRQPRISECVIITDGDVDRWVMCYYVLHIGNSKNN